MLITALVEAQIVPQDQQPALEAALKPGGLADLLVGGMKLFTLAQENAWALVAVPCGELFLALTLGVLSCPSGLNTWLRADAVYSMLTLAGAWFANLHLEQVLVRVKEDPMGAVRRWQQAEAQHQTLSRRLEQTVPGVEFHAYQLGALGVVVAAVFLAVGLLNSIVGLFELLATLIAGCNILVVVASMAFLALRCAMLFGLLQVVGALLAPVPNGAAGVQRPLLESPIDPPCRTDFYLMARGSRRQAKPGTWCWAPSPNGLVERLVLLQRVPFLACYSGFSGA
ncbi:hypothetical protein AK812_SmicGene20023 [Symbiodinium microadriaticum]|uniref:Uncharacterized protein n=1 Tax=Symbiodinium microadriaticum TaxID=2951 RepID=A0A1Q9DR06_SYMMI|nr:hypothetical protein AK812_SmicGene20023 [Symbiodinium microadriaticum]